MTFVPLNTNTQSGNTSGFTPISTTSTAKEPSLAQKLWQSLASTAGNVASYVEQPFVSLAATPVQAVAKAIGVKDPYSEGVPGLAGSNISVSPLSLEAKSGDALKVASTVGAVAAAPASLPGAAATGALIGASDMAGSAMQQEQKASDVVKKAGIGAAVGGVAAGAVYGLGKLLGSIGDKITTSVIRPTKADIEDGFSLDTIKKYNLAGSLNTTLERTKNKVSELSSQLYSKLGNSTEQVNLSDVYAATLKELTDESKLKGFGANQKILGTLNQLKGEIDVVGGSLSVPDAQIVKQAAGGFGAWQYGRQDPESKATEIVYNTFYSKLKTAIEKASPGGVKEINKELSSLIPVLNAIYRRMPVAERNNLISLGDMIGLVGSSANPIALGPTLLNLASKSGTVGAAASKAASPISSLAPVAAKTDSVIGRQVLPGQDTSQ